MENVEKIIIRIKFGLAIQKIISENKLIAKENKLKGKKDHTLITSLRKLSASSGVEYAIIQRTVAGKKNTSLTTIIAIAEGFGISEVELFTRYNKVSENEIKTFLPSTQSAKKEKLPKKPKKKK